MNIFDIARLAGVSRKTVQRALNGSPSVKPETKEKIRLIMEEHHYEPNATARKLTNKRTHTIGIFIIQEEGRYQLHTDDLYFGAVIGGIINQCTYAGYKTLITILDVSDPDPLMSLYRQKSIDAGIVVSWSNVQDIVERAASAGFRIAVFDQNNLNAPPAGVPVPPLDNRAAAYRAASYLLDLGHTDLAIVTGDMNIACSPERLAGFLQAAEERGIEVPDSNIHFGRFIEQDGAEAIRRWTSEGRLPQALFCSNDLMAYGALRTLSELGVRVPQDISVIGFDDLLISQYMQPPLTSVRVPRVEMAETLTAYLIETLDGDAEDAEKPIPVFQAELAVRGSCMPAERI
ncbi:LacI family DNA-binding transcriptional regulator [Cohnella candidum]|uniref:LacI family transcriptional regulator n=1 Tax=Cohnella candidum TaxID=2674991 RepID=A0A3G3JY39_9BACL|nr:LacI family DNA-binding transcriptional regulator [Cohnella candidum]AYQ73170.1 LacI family transcriptional regulator [Cohnella candidum]